MKERPILLELTANDAMWVWRMADVMIDMSKEVEGKDVVWSDVNRCLGEIAREVRDELSRQGVSGDPVLDEVRS